MRHPPGRPAAAARPGTSRQIRPYARPRPRPGTAPREGALMRNNTIESFLHALADRVPEVRDTADRLRDEALTLAEDDIAAFTAVTDAYRLPKGDDGRSAKRSA